MHSKDQDSDMGSCNWRCYDCFNMFEPFRAMTGGFHKLGVPIYGWFTMEYDHYKWIWVQYFMNLNLAEKIKGDDFNFPY